MLVKIDAPRKTILAPTSPPEPCRLLRADANAIWPDRGRGETGRHRLSPILDYSSGRLSVKGLGPSRAKPAGGRGRTLARRDAACLRTERLTRARDDVVGWGWPT